MRVIAGHLGGRRLVAPRGLATRPTTDRVREALFSALGPVHGARVLDLYAGTGALGIEALSRGAAAAVFVESARPAVVALRQNLAALALGGTTRVLAEPVARAVPRLLIDPLAPFDLVLADPPYDDVDAALATLESLLPAIAPGARIVLEHATRKPPRASSLLRTLRTRTYGDSAVALLARADDDATEGTATGEPAEITEPAANQTLREAPAPSENGHEGRSR